MLPFHARGLAWLAGRAYSAEMRNLLLEPVSYKVEETALGVWRRFAYENSSGFFEEFVSHRRLFGLPLLHYTHGRCPETGRAKWACGIVAVGRKAIGLLALGRFAVGLLALGQLSAGVFVVGQLAIGMLLGIGQGTTGVIAIGQLAIGVAFGLGQFTTGFVAIGQVAAGYYVFAQKGIGRFVWDTSGCSPVARQFFESLIP